MLLLPLERAVRIEPVTVVVAGDTLPQWLVYSVSIFWSVTVSRVRTKLRLGGTVGAIWFSV